MDGWLAALTQSGMAEALRYSRWGYAAVNTLHVLGIATLFGSILVLDLRLLGVKRAVALADIERVVRPVAVCGLVLAIVTGILLFFVRAPDYFALPVFRMKLVLVVAGTALALLIDRLVKLDEITRELKRAIGALSLACWFGALILGRLIAFAE